MHTDSVTDEVSVTQADRDAAANARAWCDDMDEPEMVLVFACHREAHTAPLAKPLLTLVGLTREYLPSDGISKDEFIQRILEALDNDEMAELVAELEGRK